MVLLLYSFIAIFAIHNEAFCYLFRTEESASSSSSHEELTNTFFFFFERNLTNTFTLNPLNSHINITVVVGKFWIGLVV